MIVDMEKAIVATFENIYLEGNAYIKDSKLYGNLTTTNTTNITITETALKNVTEEVLVNELNVFLTKMIKLCDTELEAGIIIPTYKDMSFNDS